MAKFEVGDIVNLENSKIEWEVTDCFKCGNDMMYSLKSADRRYKDYLDAVCESEIY